MKIGYTFDEKILDTISPIELLSQTKEMGISSIEISPAEKILSKKNISRYLSLVVKWTWISIIMFPTSQITFYMK